MSHNTIIKEMKVTDLNALRRAVTELSREGVKIGLNESGTFRTWQGQPNKCDVTVELPNEQFDVGFTKQKDGTYLPVFDHMLDRNSSIACDWRGGYHAGHNGDAIAKLIQRYGVCAAETKLANEGYATQRVINAKDKSIKLVAEY